MSAPQEFANGLRGAARLPSFGGEFMGCLEGFRVSGSGFRGGLCRV